MFVWLVNVVYIVLQCERRIHMAVMAVELVVSKSIGSFDSVTSLPPQCAKRYHELQNMQGFPHELTVPNLPAWSMMPQVAAAQEPSTLRMGYIFTVCNTKMIPMITRTFQRLYSSQDYFLYLIDTRIAPEMPNMLVESLSATLQNMSRSMLPPGASFVQVDKDGRKGYQLHIQNAPTNTWVLDMEVHMRFYFYQRITVVLQGMRFLLDPNNVGSAPGSQPDFIIHLSESDYPLHSSMYIRNYLSKHRDTNFIESINMPDPAWYWDSKSFWKNSKRASSLFTCEDHAVLWSPPKPYPKEEMYKNGYKMAHGGEWWILTRELVQYLIQENQGLNNFKEMMAYRHSVDEIFFPTIVRNIPGFTQKVDRAGKWFIRWGGHGKTSHSPDTFEGPLQVEYLGDLNQHIDEFLFIRKVTHDGSLHLLDLIDHKSRLEDGGLFGR